MFEQMKVIRMKRLKIKDNSSISKDDFFEIPNLLRVVENRALEDLERGYLCIPGTYPECRGLNKGSDDSTTN